MRNFLDHAAEHRGVRPFHDLVQLAQPQAFHHPLVLLGSADGAANQFDSGHAFHYSFSTGMPRISAMAFRSRKSSSATMVALTTLCGFRRPIDLVSTLGM